MKRIIFLLVSLVTSVLLGKLILFILEPDYVRCATGDKWDWIDALEEKLRSR